MYTEKEFRDFAHRFTWTFAKTYANTAPHEYIVLGKAGLEHKNEFVNIARFIREAGFKAFYYNTQRFYLVLDDHYYWTMDENVEDTDLINRAELNDYELIDNTWKWKRNNDAKQPRK